jgi:RNA polymerase-binding transcription factor DksA
MKAQDRKRIEKRLLEERERVQRAIRRLDDDTREGEQDGELTNYPLHPADEGTDVIEQETDFALMSAEGRQLVQIDEALRRLYDDPDNFGRCEECGQPIEMERLDLVPWARLCIKDQQASESAAG